ERIFAVDLNHAHVALNRLKFAAVRTLPDYDSFFRFFGNAADKANPAVFDALLARDLDADTVTYWRRSSLLGRRNIDGFATGFYRKGLLGWCIGFAHAVARFQGADPTRMMLAKSREEQVEIFERELAPLFDRPVVRFLLGHRAALIGLGIPPAQYDALLGSEGHMAEVVRQRLRKLACDFELKDNYFAWQAFHRGYAGVDHGPVPPYLTRENFKVLKSNIDRVSVEQVSFATFLDRQPAASLDRYVLLDAQDWMDARTLTELWAAITRTAKPGSRVIFRTAGRETILPGRVPDQILRRWRYEEARSKALDSQDRSAIYGGFHLYVLEG
ncbi:MAG: DUF3419 family protein, partial [Proteobacteria bacterium]|nr:DUF3419 family protein [Pseudomonadota bacterium]